MYKHKFGEGFTPHKQAPFGTDFSRLGISKLFDELSRHGFKISKMMRMMMMVVVMMMTVFA